MFCKPPFGITYDGLIFPLFLSDPMQRLLFHGQFWDILCDCPYEMHELTGTFGKSEIHTQESFRKSSIAI